MGKMKIITLSFLMMVIFWTVELSFTSQAAGKKPLVVSFVHRDNIGNTEDMDIDALSSATVYSGSTGEKKSTIEVIRDTIKTRVR